MCNSSKTGRQQFRPGDIGIVDEMGIRSTMSDTFTNVSDLISKIATGLKIAVVVSVAAIISAELIGGRYTAAPIGNEVVFGIYIVDRFTGSAWLCRGEACKLVKWL
jgi:hypothetical protein